MLGQILDSVEHFFSEIVTFKSRITSDCETDPQVLDRIPRHHYLRLSISELKDAEIKRAFSFIGIAATPLQRAQASDNAVRPCEYPACGESMAMAYLKRDIVLHCRKPANKTCLDMLSQSGNVWRMEWARLA